MSSIDNQKLLVFASAAENGAKADAAENQIKSGGSKSTANVHSDHVQPMHSAFARLLAQVGLKKEQR